MNQFIFFIFLGFFFYFKHGIIIVEDENQDNKWWHNCQFSMASQEGQDLNECTLPTHY